MAKKQVLVSSLILTVLIVTLSVVFLILGDKNYPLSDLLNNEIMMSLRLPRLLSVYLVGILLSTSGLLVQTMTKNPIAELSTLGISGGSACAMALLLVLGVSSSTWLSAALAMLGAFIALLVVVVLTLQSKFQPLKIVLVGSSIGLLTTSLASILTFASHNTQAYFLWIVGSFSGMTVPKLQILAVTSLVFLLLVILFGRQIKLLALDDSLATSLGLSVNRVRALVLVLVALAAGATVSSVGVISFVGLISPHLAKKFAGSSFWKNLLLTNLVGVLLLLTADLLARNLFKPYEFPAGSLILLLGAPFFISIINQETQ